MPIANLKLAAATVPFKKEQNRQSAIDNRQLRR
jgi:hypothetical protein